MKISPRINKNLVGLNSRSALGIQKFWAKLPQIDRTIIIIIVSKTSTEFISKTQVTTTGTPGHIFNNFVIADIKITCYLKVLWETKNLERIAWETLYLLDTSDSRMKQIIGNTIQYP